MLLMSIILEKYVIVNRNILRRLATNISTSLSDIIYDGDKQVPIGKGGKIGASCKKVKGDIEDIKEEIINAVEEVKLPKYNEKMIHRKKILL